MSVCTFFGHYNCPGSIKQILRDTLIMLITTKGADTFYVGHQGKFDEYIFSILEELAVEYSHIQYTKVLLYRADKKDSDYDGCHTMLMEKGRTAPTRYAIVCRNDWMLQQADYVVSYVRFSVGYAAQFAAKAQQQGKMVIRL